MRPQKNGAIGSAGLKLSIDIYWLTNLSIDKYPEVGYESVRTRIHSFLIEFKKAATGGKGVFLVPRHDSMVTLSHLGLTKRNLAEILLTLSVEDYCNGPEDDRDQGGEIWVFGKLIRGYEIYIKLKVAVVDGDSIAKCISFHIAKFPLRYPCKTCGPDDGREV
jgi:hypothetical protein